MDEKNAKNASEAIRLNRPKRLNRLNLTWNDLVRWTDYMDAGGAGIKFDITGYFTIIICSTWVLTAAAEF
jgi:hypothetical protein